MTVRGGVTPSTLTLGGAVVGALLALWSIVAESFALLLIVVTGIVVGTLLAASVLTESDTRAEGHSEAEENAPEPRHWGGSPSAPPSEVPVTPGPPVEAGRVVLPLREPDGEWWSQLSPPGTNPDPSQAVRLPPPPDLTGYIGSARVVQCPRCAGFRLNVEHAASAYAFDCQTCGHRWTWRPGTPWPTTIKVGRQQPNNPVRER